MVKLPSKHLAAKPLPVAAGIAEMEMPRLIHFPRWRHRMTRFDGQIEKSSVFLDHPRRILPGPALFRSESLRERKIRVGLIEREPLQPIP
jgi:hypothetical protein